MKRKIEDQASAKAKSSRLDEEWEDPAIFLSRMSTQKEPFVPVPPPVASYVPLTPTPFGVPSLAPLIHNFTPALPSAPPLEDEKFVKPRPTSPTKRFSAKLDELPLEKPPVVGGVRVFPASSTSFYGPSSSCSSSSSSSMSSSVAASSSSFKSSCSCSSSLARPRSKGSVPNAPKSPAFPQYQPFSNLPPKRETEPLLPYPNSSPHSYPTSTPHSHSEPRSSNTSTPPSSSTPRSSIAGTPPRSASSLLKTSKKPNCCWRVTEGLLSLFARVPRQNSDFRQLPTIPPIAWVLVVAFLAFAVLIELLPFWMLVGSLVVLWTSINPQRQTVHVFVDHSNLVWSNVHQRLKQDRKLSYHNLVQFLRRPKSVLGLISYLVTSRCLRERGTLFLAGSMPAMPSMQLETHPQWEEARKAGFELRVLPRVHREYAVDDVIHKAIATTILQRAARCWWALGWRPRDVIIIVSGDANDNNGHGGFPQQARLALAQGFAVEVWAMSDSLGKKGYAECMQLPHFSMFTLDPYCDEFYVSRR